MELITKADFSRIAKISRAAVTKLCQNSLLSAVVSGKINLDAECVASYLSLKNITPEADRKIQSGSELKDTKTPDSSADVSSFEEMTLSELCEIFGTDERFKVWLTGRRLITEIKIKELKLAQDKGLLVSRELVSLGIIDPFDACHIKLLTDGAKTIARRATAMHAAERPLEDIEKFVAEQITSFIRPVKAKVARALKNA